MYKFKYDSKLIILIGNIASGKSTYLKTVQDTHVVVSRDKIRYSIGNGNYVFDKKLEPAVCWAARTLAEELMQTKVNIVLDEVNVSVRLRYPIISAAKSAGYHVKAVVMPYVERDESVARRMQSPHGDFTAEEWGKIWDVFNETFQLPRIEEGIDEIEQVKG